MYILEVKIRKLKKFGFLEFLGDRVLDIQEQLIISDPF